MSKRAATGVLIVALWLGGVTMMVSRNANRSEAQKLAEVALRLEPATFYYAIERDGRPVGAASSALDTTAKSLVSQEYFVGEYPGLPGGAPEHVSARWQTTLTRGMHLAELNAVVDRPIRPVSINATVQDDSAIFIAGRKASRRPPARYTFTAPLFTPATAPVFFMLGGSRQIGRSQTISVFDPISRTVLRPTLRIRAESLFTVVDSAALERTGVWKPAHRDTVRAWRIGGAPYGLVAWVDAEGRVVAARAGNLSATRTAFEIAFRNPTIR